MHAVISVGNNRDNGKENGTIQKARRGRKAPADLEDHARSPCGDLYKTKGGFL